MSRMRLDSDWGGSTPTAKTQAPKQQAPLETALPTPIERIVEMFRRMTAIACALVMALATVSAPPAAAPPLVWYQAHVQSIGDQAAVFDGATAGTTGKSLRMEGVRIYGAPIEYRVHSQDVGWGPWVQDAWAGTKGRGLRAEAVQIRTGHQADKNLHVEYRAHIQNVGWGPWVADGAVAGTTGRSLRMEALQVRLVYRA